MTARLTNNGPAGLVAAALAHGLILAVMVSALMRIALVHGSFALLFFGETVAALCRGPVATPLS